MQQDESGGVVTELESHIMDLDSQLHLALLQGEELQHQLKQVGLGFRAQHETGRRGLRHQLKQAGFGRYLGGKLQHPSRVMLLHQLESSRPCLIAKQPLRIPRRWS